tara:strand:+ start:2513 stop:2659 length:147 start_codon:yes stop_codon:yes gene_type:complete
MICTIIANVNRDPKARRKPYQISDFMPKQKPKSKKELIAKIKQIKTGI